MNIYLICLFFIYKKFGTINGLYLAKPKLRIFSWDT